MYTQIAKTMKQRLKIPYEYLGIARAVGSDWLRREPPNFPEAKESVSQAHIDDLVHTALASLEHSQHYYEQVILGSWEDYLKKPAGENDEFYATTVWGRRGSEAWKCYGIDHLTRDMDVDSWLKDIGRDLKQ